MLEPLVNLSYRRYLQTDRTWSAGYAAMRKLFGSARGSSFESLVRRTTSESRLLDLPEPAGLLAGHVDSIVADLRRDGLAMLDMSLPGEACDALEAIANATPCDLTEASDGAPPQAVFDPRTPWAVRYDVPEEALLASEVVQSLLADRSILAVAQGYLTGAPVHDLVAMWWSTPSTVGSSAAAQMFHFDLDRVRFVKLFAYLTDVGPDNGPHHYVRGSHRNLPRALRADRRFSDDEVLEHFPAEAIASITGARGSMFMADTRGLHKGLNVANGHRLVFQLEYTTSLFGKPIDRLPVDVRAPELQAAIDDFPRTYRRLQIVS